MCHWKGLGILFRMVCKSLASREFENFTGLPTLITSRLDFCNSILYNLPNKQIERLQRIQTQAARMLKRIPRRNHITPVLRELHWLRIHDIIFVLMFL